MVGIKGGKWWLYFRTRIKHTHSIQMGLIWDCALLHFSAEQRGGAANRKSFPPARACCLRRPGPHPVVGGCTVAVLDPCTGTHHGCAALAVLVAPLWALYCSCTGQPFLAVLAVPGRGCGACTGCNVTLSRNLDESPLRDCPGQKRARARASANAPGGHARQGTCSLIAVVSIAIDKSLRIRIV
jgi:hypothetical protein